MDEYNDTDRMLEREIKVWIVVTATLGYGFMAIAHAVIGYFLHV